MSDVFISYSRKDKAFVKVLHQALTASTYNAWVDWEDIPLTADWWQEIKSGIEQADTFIFVISSDSVRSKVCGQELDHAIAHNKRLIPIVRRDGFDSELIRPTLSKHNWLFFREEDDFEQAFQSLVKALDTDLDHVKRHTRLLVKAIEWEHQHRNSDLLMRGSELEHTIQWLTQSSNKEPRSTELQLEYVNESRKAELAQRDAEIKRQKKARKAIATTLVGALVCLMIAIGLGLFSFSQYQTAEAQRQQATISEIRAITTSSNASYDSNRGLDALTEALKARSRLDSAPWADEATRQQVRLSSQQAVYDIREKNRLEGHLDAVQGLSFSPDGKAIASASFDKTIKLWSLDGYGIKTLRGHRSRVYSVKFSPDGKMLASASGDRTIKLWNLEGQELQTFQNINSIFAIDFSPDGKTLISSSFDSTGEGVIGLWSLEGQLRRTIKTSEASSDTVSFSPDGTTIAIASDKTVRLFSLNGQELKTREFSGSITDLSFSPDGETIVCSTDDGNISVWNIETQEFKTFRAIQSGSFHSVSFSPYGKTVASSDSNGMIAVWTPAGQMLTTFQGGYGGRSSVVRFSPDGQTIAYGHADGSVTLWGLQNQELRTFQGHDGFVRGVSVSPDGKTIASASADQTIKLWTVDGQVIKTLQGHTDEVTTVRFNPDGKIIASGSADKTVKLWTVQGQLLATLTGHTDWVNDVQFSPDGKTLASASWDGTIKLWNLSGQAIRTFKNNGLGVLGISFSPDGQTIAAANANWDKTVTLWSVKGELLNTLKGHNAAITGVNFSPDGKMIATASDDRVIKLWSYPEGRELSSFRTRIQVSMVRFSPNGQFLVTASKDNTIKFWTLDGQELKSLRGHTGLVRDISFSLDGKTLASASEDRTIKLWNATILDEEQLMTRGCQWTQEYLILHPEILQTTEACQSDVLFTQAVPTLMAQAEDLARDGDTQSAIAKLQTALDWNPQLDINPEETVQQFAVRGQAEQLIVEADRLASQGKIREAIAFYTEAQALDPDLQISADSWDILCWYGSLRNFAQEVVVACDRAVELSPNDWSSPESRAANRALRGDFKGAIADLEKAIANGIPDEESRTRWQRWMTTLQAGKNPLTTDEIEAMLSE
ncbi:MAG: TIR domain-containing protein [Oculatellaceae cyanobacterium bins.114]|nr:TIR domain-containing protein [Oculatellaceae cyanobacterium bins.114]